MAKRIKVDIAPAAPQFPDESVEQAFTSLTRAYGYPTELIDGYKKTLAAALAAHPAFLASVWNDVKRLAVEIAPLGSVESVPYPARSVMLDRLLDLYRLGVLLRIGGEDARIAAFLKETADGPVRSRICDVLNENGDYGLEPVQQDKVFALLESSKDPDVLASVLAAEFRLKPDAARKRWKRVLETREPVEQVVAVLHTGIYLDAEGIAELCAEHGHYHAETDDEIFGAFVRAAKGHKPTFLSFIRWARTQPVTAHLVERVTGQLLVFEGNYVVDDVIETMHALVAGAAASEDKKAANALKNAYKRFKFPAPPKAPKVKAKA